MLRRLVNAAAISLLFASVAIAQETPSTGQPGSWLNMWKDNPTAPWELKNMSPEQRQRLARYSAFMNQDVPQAYLDATNDVGFTTEAIFAGGKLYAQNCAKCHGETGLGNGEMAANLAPSPALLAYLMDQPIAIDSYLLWTISEGGVAFGTKMPAFKNVLSKEQIWQIVAYLRAGFPAVGATPAER